MIANNRRGNWIPATVFFLYVETLFYIQKQKKKNSAASISFPMDLQTLITPKKITATKSANIPLTKIKKCGCKL